MSQTEPLILNDDLEAGGKDDDGIEYDFAYRNNVQNAPKSIRLGFIRKVYGLLCAQLLLTVVIASVFMFTPPIKEFLHTYYGLIHIPTFLTFGILFALFVKRYDTPANLILLAAFTVSISLTVGWIVTFYSQIIVIKALVLTFAVVAGLTAFTFQTKYDFSPLYSGLVAGVWILFLAGLMQIFVQSSPFELILSIGGALLFSLFIVVDTQLILKKLSPEEYILATINLYMDIINLFLYILRILQETSR